MWSRSRMSLFTHKKATNELFNSLQRIMLSTETDILELFHPKEPRDYEKELSSEKTSNANHKPKKDVVIKCSRPQFNHYKNQKYEKFKPIPLASKGWHHNKSGGDFFSIHIFDEDYDNNQLFWEDRSVSFSDIKLEEILQNALKEIGYEHPTKIQMESMPVLLSGRNSLIAAETGCGKTLAFLVPLFQQILHWQKVLGTERDPNTPLALIITPSRELAVQIGRIAKELSHRLPVICDVLTGGRTKQKMLNPQYKRVDLQIATLGAMSKLTTTGIYNVQEIRHVVLDEADTLLDDSFNSLLQRFLRKIKIRYQPRSGEEMPSGCQLSLVSATFPTSLYSTLEDIIEPDSLEKVTTKNLHRILPHVPQTFYRLGPTQKPGKLLHTVKKAIHYNQPTIIFSNKAPTCDWVSLMLHENGVEAVNLNGAMPLVVRMGKFDQFLNGEVNILSCTDIASRGLDTRHVKHVINYDFPLYIADYIHRCGRTGRCGSPAECHVTNFVSGAREVDLVNQIEMAARTMESLPNVNGNITKIINNEIRKLDRDGKLPRL